MVLADWLAAGPLLNLYQRHLQNKDHTTGLSWLLRGLNKMIQAEYVAQINGLMKIEYDDFRHL